MKTPDHFLNGQIVYESKYGATRQYAGWLAEKLDLPVSTTGEITADQMNDAGFILVGSPVYAGRFRVKEWLKKNVKNIKDKKLFFFIVTGTTSDEQERRNRFVLDNIPPEIKQHAEIYFLQGRLIHRKLTFFDRLIVRIGAATMKDPAKRKAMQQDLDEVKETNLLPILKGVYAFCYGKDYLTTGKGMPQYEPLM